MAEVHNSVIYIFKISSTIITISDTLTSLFKVSVIIIISMQPSGVLSTCGDVACCLHAKRALFAGRRQHSTVCFACISSARR